MNNKNINNSKIVDDEFIDLGSLKEFCEKFGGIKVLKIDSKDGYNIVLIVETFDDIELKFKCSRALTEIINGLDSFSEECLDYRVYKIIKKNGERYIRVTKVIHAEGNPNISLEDNIKKLDSIKGSVIIWFEAEDLKVEPYKNEKLNLDDLIAL